MAKGKTATVFFCQNCGYESTKWLGQCPGCREWNTFVEETIDKTVLKNTGTGSRRERREASEPCVLSEIAIREENKTLTGIIRGSVNLPCCFRCVTICQRPDIRYCISPARNPRYRSRCGRTGSAHFRNICSCCVRRIWTSSAK